MINEFLNNVYDGKNNWWRYLITIFLSWIASNLIAAFFFVFLVFFYFIFTGNQDINIIIDFIGSYDSNIIVFFEITFLVISFSLIFLYISVKFIHDRDFMSLINISRKYDEFSGKAISLVNRIRWGLVLKGALIWLSFLLIILLISFSLNPEIFYLNLNIENFYLVIFLFLLAIPIQVLFEELFFRGYLIQGLSIKIKSPIIVILISSIIFSLGHILNGGSDPIFMITNIVDTFIVGMILCVATLATNGIEWAVGAHFANNFFAFLITSSEGSIGSFETMIQTTVAPDPLLDLIVSTITLLIFAGILFFYKKEKILRGLGIN